MAWITRLLTLITFLAIGVIFSPKNFGSVKITTFVKLVHLLCISTAWGVVVWGVYVGGFVMFLTLPRHQFGNLRGKVFPVCFTTVGICCAVSVGCFSYTHPWKSSSIDEKYQLGILVATFILNLTNLFVFTPMTIKTMKQRHKVEREVAKGNPKLAAINKKFGMLHGVAALATIMTSANLAMHSWYLATKIDL